MFVLRALLHVRLCEKSDFRREVDVPQAEEEEFAEDIIMTS